MSDNKVMTSKLIEANIQKIQQGYRFCWLADKLEEIRDYAHAGSVGNEAVSYAAIERLTNEATSMLNAIRDANTKLDHTF